MPHIFFERLERRRSTQAFIGSGTQSLMGSMGIGINGISGFSTYTLSAQSGISGSYMQGMVYCYAIGPTFPPYGQDGLYGGSSWPIFEPLNLFNEPLNFFKIETPKLPLNEIPWFIPTQLPWQRPWLNPSFKHPLMIYLNNWLSPIQNYQQIPLDYSPSWNYFNNWLSSITNYPQTSSIPLYPWDRNMNNHNRLNNLRKELLAFFRKKGILNDKQRQRLLSTPFEKA